MKKLISGILFACLFAVGVSVGQAQDMKAKKMEGHTWHQVVMVKFKPGTYSDAKKIIDANFMKAGMTAKLPGPQIIEFKSGEWDTMFIWTMKSIDDMDWEVHPDDEAWWMALAEQEGGSDKAGEIMQKYMSMIDQSTSYLAVSRKAGMSNETLSSND